MSSSIVANTCCQSLSFLLTSLSTLRAHGQHTLLIGTTPFQTFPKSLGHTCGTDFERIRSTLSVVDKNRLSIEDSGRHLGSAASASPPQQSVDHHRSAYTTCLFAWAVGFVRGLEEWGVGESVWGVGESAGSHLVGRGL